MNNTIYAPTKRQNVFQVIITSKTSVKESNTKKKTKRPLLRHRSTITEMKFRSNPNSFLSIVAYPGNDRSLPILTERVNCTWTIKVFTKLEECYKCDLNLSYSRRYFLLATRVRFESVWRIAREHLIEEYHICVSDVPFLSIILDLLDFHIISAS